MDDEITSPQHRSTDDYENWHVYVFFCGEGFCAFLFVPTPHQVALQPINFCTVQSITKLSTGSPKVMPTCIYRQYFAMFPLNRLLMITPFLCTRASLYIAWTFDLISPRQPMTVRKPNGWTPESRNSECNSRSQKETTPSQDHGVEKGFRGKHQRERWCCLLPHK
ncbi:uncharacterized protein TNCV_4275261 [Trichonephila clavipes]|nr:uncharacterized protein TNCV_4275261 [Trichonephila clavipes]